MAVRVDVVKVRPIQGKGNLKAFASVQIAGKMTIHSCRIVQQAGQVPWVSLPQESYTDKEGKTKYSPIVEIPEEWKPDIQAAVLGAYHEILTDNQDQGGAW
jgi:DNA-binding cell septation regulator SpoVG